MFFLFSIFYVHMQLFSPGLFPLFYKAGNYKPSCIWSESMKKPVMLEKWGGRSSFLVIGERKAGINGQCLDCTKSVSENPWDYLIAARTGLFDERSGKICDGIIEWKTHIFFIQFHAST